MSRPFYIARFLIEIGDLAIFLSFCRCTCRVPQDQIGNAGLACGAEDYAGKPERGRAEKEQLHEQEVRQEEENRQSSR